jgi:hypothetical protein
VSILNVLRVRRFVLAMLVSIMPAGQVFAQTEQGTPGPPPTMIPLSGQLRGPSGEPLRGNVLLGISMYSQQDDATALWVEQQVVTLTESGGYTVLVGATLDAGVPAHVFAAGGEARWLGVSVDGGPEQPRVLIVSVPYAARAGSADTLGGKSPAEFVLSDNVADAVRTALKAPEVRGDLAAADVNIQATPDVVPKWNGALSLVESSISNVGARVGIGTTNPQFTLDVNGDGGFGNNLSVQGLLSFPRGFITHRNGQLILTGGSGSALHLGSNYNFNRLVIGLTGNVGLGTADPTEELHVETFDNGRLRMTRKGCFACPSVDNVLLGDISGTNDGGLLLYDGSGALKTAFRGDGTTFINSGNVGIGTSSPAAKLHVAGNGRFDGTVTTGSLAAKFQDVAEWVDAAEPIAAGTVVVIDETRNNGVTASSTSYDSRVAGAVSPQPGLVLGEPGPSRVLVAQSGRVRVKVDARYGAITPGDLLVTSPRRGHAMRAKPMRVNGVAMHRPGTVLGKALEPLAAGTGEILVLLTLQ